MSPPPPPSARSLFRLLCFPHSPPSSPLLLLRFPVSRPPRKRGIVASCLSPESPFPSLLSPLPRRSPAPTPAMLVLVILRPPATSLSGVFSPPLRGRIPLVPGTTSKSVHLCPQVFFRMNRGASQELEKDHSGTSPIFPSAPPLPRRTTVSFLSCSTTFFSFPLCFVFLSIAT